MTERIATTGSPALNRTGGAVAFADVDLADTHTVSVRPQVPGALGTFTLGAVEGGAGSGSVGWSFQVADGDLDPLAAGR